MQTALDDLVTLLDLEAIEVNLFRGRSPDENRQRVFGGQVAGQALVAATRTIDEPNRLVHSLHAYFLRPGDPTDADPVRGRPHPRRQELHHPPRRRHPARQGDLQPAGQLPRRTSRGPTISSPMPTGLPAPDDAARLQDADGAVQGADGRVVRPAAADRHPLHRRAIRSAARAARRSASGCGCAPTASCPTTPRCTRASSPTPAT